MKILFFTTLLLWAGVAFGQSFEGTLTYYSEIDILEKFKKMGLTKEMLVAKMKEDGSYSDTIKTSYKQGNYYSVLNSNPKNKLIYKSADNKLYVMRDGSDVCSVTDVSIDLESTMTGKMPTVQKLDTTVVVNGASCSIVRVQWKSGTYDYYYNPTKLSADPNLFANHTYDGWAEFLKISRALPVRIVKTMNGMMTVTQTLVFTKAGPVDEKLFTLPTLVPDKDLNIIKMPNGEIMRIKN